MSEFVELSEAIERHVKDSDTVALEGFTHLIPFAAGHEIIRQGQGDLTLVRMTPDLIYDQMIGAGCARKLIFSWGGNPLAIGAAFGDGALGLVGPLIAFSQWYNQSETEAHEVIHL